jgi:hypothetical protein
MNGGGRKKHFHEISTKRIVRGKGGLLTKGESILHVELRLKVVEQLIEIRQIFNLLKIADLVAQRFAARGHR